jgi:hypothetical protein
MAGWTLRSLHLTRKERQWMLRSIRVRPIPRAKMGSRT